MTHSPTPEERVDGTTHAAGCWSWGRRHYECAVDEIQRLQLENAKLRRGEFYCSRCGIRKDGEIDGQPDF